MIDGKVPHEELQTHQHSQVNMENEVHTSPFHSYTDSTPALVGKKTPALDIIDMGDKILIGKCNLDI